MLTSINPPTLEQVRGAAGRIADLAVRTPLLRLQSECPAEVFIKLENLQPIGSFKLRGAGNAMRLASPSDLAQGVYTASAGNMAQGVAWVARGLGVPCSVVVPDHAPQTKLDAIIRLGAQFIRIPFQEWWDVLMAGEYAALTGHFVHPVCDQDVMAGNGTIGLEIVDALPEVDSVIVPWGGGGLSCGIAAAIHAVRPQTAVYACEVATGAPLAASLRAGEPIEVSRTPSFVDGMGGRSLLTPMWPLAQSLIAGSIVVSPDQIAEAIRLLAERHSVIAEGAGAASVAAALTGQAGGGRIACVISGGNLDRHVLATILGGGLP